MQAYRPQIRETFEALAYLVKRLDPNGIELYFTTTDVKGHETHRDELLALFDKVTFDGQSSMELTLSRILDHGKQKRWSMSRFRSQRSQGKSVYVLTDGKWHGRTNAADGIPELVKRQIAKSSTKIDLGIQFIQFGTDHVGTLRLDELDDGLEAYGVGM